MTKREVINAMLSDANVVANEDYVAYLKNELNLLDKKNSRAKKPSKNQIANESIKDEILAVLKDADSAMTATQVAEAMNLSVNKVSALLTQLKEDNSVVRTVEKRKAYFTVA